MKPIKLLHTNVYEEYKIAVVEIELTGEDKDMIYLYHINNGGRIYDKNDVSMLAFIKINKGGNVIGYDTDTTCYYPEEMGEHYIETKFIAPSLEQLCIEFVKENYFGNESKYNC